VSPRKSCRRPSRRCGLRSRNGWAGWSVMQVERMPKKSPAGAGPRGDYSIRVPPERRGSRIPSQTGRLSYSPMASVVVAERMGDRGRRSDRPAPRGGEAAGALKRSLEMRQRASPALPSRWPGSVTDRNASKTGTGAGAVETYCPDSYQLTTCRRGDDIGQIPESCTAITITRSPRRRGRAAWVARRGRAPWRS
jgi:hypothetical protein